MPIMSVVKYPVCNEVILVPDLLNNTHHSFIEKYALIFPLSVKDHTKVVDNCHINNLLINIARIVQIINSN